MKKNKKKNQWNWQLERKVADNIRTTRYVRNFKEEKISEVCNWGQSSTYKPCEYVWKYMSLESIARDGACQNYNDTSATQILRSYFELIFDLILMKKSNQPVFIFKNHV